MTFVTALEALAPIFGSFHFRFPKPHTAASVPVWNVFKNNELGVFEGGKRGWMAGLAGQNLPMRLGISAVATVR